MGSLFGANRREEMAKETEKNVVLQLVVDDGFVKVPMVNLQGEEIGSFSFQPTDVEIVNRFNESMSKFDEVLAPLSEADESADSVAALNEARDRLFRLLDYIFKADTGKSLFGRMHPFSPVGGRFYCEEVLDKLGSFIQAQFGEETKKVNARMQKYVKQYARKGGSK